MVLTDSGVVLINDMLKTRRAQWSRLGGPLSASSNTKNPFKSSPPHRDFDHTAATLLARLSANSLDVLSRS